MSNKLRLEVTPLIKGFDGNFKTDEYLTFNYASHASVRVFEGRNLSAQTMFEELDDALNAVAAVAIANNVDILKVNIRDRSDEMEIVRNLEGKHDALKEEYENNADIQANIENNFSIKFINREIPMLNTAPAPSM